MVDPSKYKIGQSASIDRSFCLEDVASFANLCGDTNPIHLDAEYAANTRFKRRIIHGPLVASLFGTIFGTIFPGQGSIYISQTLRFRKPVFLGDAVTASVRLIAVDKEKSKGEFETICKNESQEVVIEGEAQLLLP